MAHKMLYRGSGDNPGEIITANRRAFDDLNEASLIEEETLLASKLIKALQIRGAPSLATILLIVLGIGLVPCARQSSTKV